MGLELRDRFEEKYLPEPNSGCWLWTASTDKGGYGKITVDRRQIGAHRISYQLHKGQIPAGLDLDHVCRVRCCVNPDHLEPVSRSENCRRGDTGKSAGERKRAKTHCPQGHGYTVENTYIDNNGGRHCRLCRQETIRRHGAAYMRKWRAKMCARGGV